MFAAVNTVEPPILELATPKLLEGDKPWHAERLPLVEDRVRGRLAAYVARGESRPAYKRAFDAQLAVYTGKPPKRR
jgi:glutathione S-transferase